MFDWAALSLTEQILFIAFCIFAAIQLTYFLAFFIRIPFHKDSEKKQSDEGVSVILCARNEEKNLRELIPLLMGQNHPNFEVIVVNDNSWDSTQETLEALEVTYKNLHIIQLDEEKQRMSGKKFAVTLGLKAAKNDVILFTDADCRPSSKQWIKNMTAGISGEVEICLGYSPYQKESGLLNGIIRFDAFQIGLLYLSFAKAGIPYMGVGRNLAYRKSLFFKHGGFRTHYKLASGDDDLFVNEASNKQNTAVALNQDCLVHTFAKSTWKKWWHQKRRHFTTAPRYRTLHKLLLALFPFSWWMMVATGVALLVFNKVWLLVTVILGVRYLLQIAIFKGSSKLMGNTDVAWLSPVYELLIMVLNPVIYWSNIINKPKEWA